MSAPTLELPGAGSKFLATAGGRLLAVDCGLYQGQKELRLRAGDRLPVDAASVWVALTHAHIDHTGHLPRFRAAGFRGPVYATRCRIR